MPLQYFHSSTSVDFPLTHKAFLGSFLLSIVPVLGVVEDRSSRIERSPWLLNQYSET
jgi:hypothetical protein